MKFYYFGGKMGDYGNPKTPSNLNKNHFSGVMFTYDIPEGDMFVKTALDINPNENIKYLIAIRPYTISPQYLSMINKSMNKIDRDRLQINLILGHTKEHEEGVYGIVGDVNDQSSSIDKSKYLISFIETLNDMNQDKEGPGQPFDPNHSNKLDIFVSATNRYLFETAKKYNYKMIMPYHIYHLNHWPDLDESIKKGPLELENTEIMLAITPIIRETEEELSLLTNYAIRPGWRKGDPPRVVLDVVYFTYEQFDDFVETLERKGINKLLINSVPQEEERIIIPFIKEYVESKKQQLESEIK